MELWELYDVLPSVTPQPVDSKPAGSPMDGAQMKAVELRLKILDMVLETRKAGERADPRKPAGASSDPALSKARVRANGTVRHP